MISRAALGLCCWVVLISPAALAAALEVLPFKVPEQLPDVTQLPLPCDVRLEGYLGTRVANNEKNRLLAVNEDELLAGFRKRPGKQEWIGEHAGKFLHAATLAWLNSGDAQLRAGSAAGSGRTPARPHAQLRYAPEREPGERGGPGEAPVREPHPGRAPPAEGSSPGGLTTPGVPRVGGRRWGR